MRLELIRGNEIVSLKWYEVLETKNIAEKGQPRKLWTDFGTQSKLDLTATRYQVRLVAFHADGKEALYSEERAIDLREDGLNFLKQNCITDQTGVRKAHLGLFFADGAYSAEAATLQTLPINVKKNARSPALSPSPRHTMRDRKAEKRATTPTLIKLFGLISDIQFFTSASTGRLIEPALRHNSSTAKY